MKNGRKTACILVSALLLLLLLASCGSGMKASEANYAKYDSAYSPSPAEYDMSGGSDGYSYYEKTAEGESAAVSGASLPNDSARKLIKTVRLEMETKEFDTCLAAVYDRIGAAGGYVESSDIRGGTSYGRYYTRRASLTVRVPAERLEEFAEGVGSLANLLSRTENASDVTNAYYDTESHIRALRSEYDTLIGILEKCTELTDVISVQSRITTVLYQIDSYETQLKNYDSLVAYSTVNMTIDEVEHETAVVEQTVGQRMSEGFSRTMEDVREGLQDFAVGFVTYLPYIVIWLVVIALAVLIIRSLYRRQRRRAAKTKEKAE